MATTIVTPHCIKLRHHGTMFEDIGHAFQDPSAEAIGLKAVAELYRKKGSRIEPDGNAIILVDGQEGQATQWVKAEADVEIDASEYIISYARWLADLNYHPILNTSHGLWRIVFPTFVIYRAEDLQSALRSAQADATDPSGIEMSTSSRASLATIGLPRYASHHEALVNYTLANEALELLRDFRAEQFSQVSAMGFELGPIASDQFLSASLED